MRYRRARRLSKAARALADGASGILDVALGAGYGSHAAFTHAFRDQFGLTPEACGERRDLSQLTLVEALRMNPLENMDLSPNRIVQAEPRPVAGLARHYACGDMAGIPAQWQRFNGDAPFVASRNGDAAYGVCYNTDDLGNIDYLCGIEVSSFSALPDGWERLRLPPGSYAVFLHEGHVSTIGSTWRGIFEHWLPVSGREIADGPTFERYGSSFDPATGLGGFEIWIPLKT